MTTNPPVLLIAFNRPAQTMRVLNEIREARPAHLYFAVDGPRAGRADDAANVAEVRALVETVDWPCRVHTLFRETNLGCKSGVTSAIDWYFGQVEAGIILEDDCLPDPTFFVFCREMLEHFRDDKRIGMVSGYNIGGTTETPYSYVFSRYGHIWGWATWRRAWEGYDAAMPYWTSREARAKIRRAIADPRQWRHRSKRYEEVYLGLKDTWDYQWEAHRLLRGQLSIIPTNNLIENIGFGADATHTKSTSSKMILPRRSMSLPIRHNPAIITDNRYDSLLRPVGSTTRSIMTRIKKIAVNIAKAVTPPVVYALARRVLRGERALSPRWNTIAYAPLSGVQIYFDPAGQWQRKMMDGSYDKFLFDKIAAHDPKGKVIYDIGAHIGFHSLYFARLVGKNGKVYAFEPNLVNYKRMELIRDKNTDLKGIISTYNVAVSDKSGTEEFTVNDDIESGRSSGNWIGGADPFWHKDIYSSKGFTKTSVRTVSIDALASELGIAEAPDIIKLDVEGAEYLALQGARHTLLTKKPIILIEIHSMQNMFNVTQLLRDMQYTATIIRVERNGVCYLEATPRV